MARASQPRPRERPARVFVSYRQEDRSLARRLQRASDAFAGIELHALPADPVSANDWRDTCARLIRDSDAIICLVGRTTADSRNVAWELDEGSKRGIPIVLAGCGAGALAELRSDDAVAIEDADPEVILARLENLV